jgi:eukaryotic-like serine/threonine-protein kinase
VDFGIGSIVGDYEITALLGRGAMGTVYQVRNTISDRIEAMKVLHSSASEAEETASRFAREIKVVGSLDHPNIAQLRTAMRSQNQLIMVMEYVEGCPLDERMRQGRLDPAQSLDFTLQVLLALGYAHQQGVIHRDIKPQNILVTPRGVVKLTDFGIARKVGDPRQTAVGATVGTAFYMSPEQVRSEQPDGRSDLYALGVTAYEMLTGRRPIQGETYYAVLHAHLAQIPTPPHILNPEVAPAISAIILKSLEKEPASRYQTAEEFRQAILALPSETAPIPIPRLAVDSVRAPTGPHPAPQAGIRADSPLADSPSGSTLGGGWDPAMIDKIRKELAIYIGPLAKVIVNRASKKARTAEELCNLVAPEIPAESDRRKFLAACPR